MSYVRDKLQSNGHYHTIYDVIRIVKGFLYDNELIVHYPFYYMVNKKNGFINLSWYCLIIRVKKSDAEWDHNMPRLTNDNKVFQSNAFLHFHLCKDFACCKS